MKKIHQFVTKLFDRVQHLSCDITPTHFLSFLRSRQTFTQLQAVSVKML